jgi:tetratricopeptide (TPR) repeat protein
MRLYLLTDQPGPAATAADAVREILSQPERLGLVASDLKQLQAQRDRLEPLVAESYVRMQRYDDAEAVYRAIHQMRPNAALLAVHLARIAVEQKNWKVARERLEPYFSEKASAAGFQPYDLLGRVIAGEVSDQAQAKAETLLALRQLRERDPNNNALAYFTADKLLAAEDFVAAAKLFEELLVRQPTTTAYRHLARIYRQQKDPEALLGLIGRAVDQASSRDLLGAEGASIVKDSPLFEQLLSRLKNPPQAPATTVPASALIGVSLLSLSGGKVDVARELYEKALAVPEADATKVRETIGMAALLADQHRFAAEIFEQAITAKPPNDKLAAYHYYLASAWEFAGETEKALAAAAKCVVLKPDSVQFQSRAPWVLYHAKRFEESERRYRELLTKFDMKYESEEVRDQLRQARLILSNICVLTNRLPEAEEWLEQVLDEFPEYVGALNDLGYLWADQGKRLHRALRMVEQAVAGDPDNAAYRDSLGWAYYRLGRYSDAVRELQRAAAGAPDGVIFDHLGDAYLKLDDRPKALAAWRKGAELLEDPDEAQQLAITTAKIKQYSDPKK